MLHHVCDCCNSDFMPKQFRGIFRVTLSVKKFEEFMTEFLKKDSQRIKFLEGFYPLLQ